MSDLSNSRVPKAYPTYVKTLITTPVINTTMTR